MRVLKLLSFVLFLNVWTTASQEGSDHPNVLFIAVDDLRPDLGVYGNEIVKTPNIDKLASEGMTFNKHYVQVPTCGASRYSIMTGMLPRKKLDLSNHAIKEQITSAPEIARPETFIHHLKRNGYYTVGMGKLSHFPEGLVYGYTETPDVEERELPYSWNELLFDPGKWETGWNAFFGYADGSNRQSRNRKVKPYEKGKVDDSGYIDGLTAALAVDKLKKLAKRDQPFFLGVGFFRPHLPWNAPAKYWELYEEEDIPLTPSPDIPENINKASLYNSSEFNQYRNGEELASLNDPISDSYARKLKHAYYASVSYIDAQIGKLLEALESSGLAKNTIVFLWSDHGWQLGDHRVWGKHTLFEKALHSPLIIKVPRMENQGIASEEIVSSIDIYPSIVELCGLEMPHETDGKSFVALLNHPENAAWEGGAFSYFNRGISLRTDRYRITKYFRDAEPKVELYDHKNDPAENCNIATENPELVEELLLQLEKGNLGIY